jgi:hypothetical protein
MYSMNTRWDGLTWRRLNAPNPMNAASNSLWINKNPYTPPDLVPSATKKSSTKVLKGIDYYGRTKEITLESGTKKETSG